MITKIIFGEKTFEKLFLEIEKANCKNPLLICGKHFQSTNQFNLFKSKMSSFELFDSIEPNPSIDSVNSAAKLLNKKNCDCVIGIGGGSVLDASKVVAVMKDFENSCEDFYHSFDSIKKTVPFFALPTTSGTGSELTKYSVLTLPSKIKKTLRSKKFYAKIAIVDSELTYSMPSSLTATTGLDAFCQAIESYWAVNATTQTKAHAKEAIQLAFFSLAKAVNYPEHSSRQDMALASITAAKAFDYTGTTACHSISYAFTQMYGLAHGFAVALTLPWFLEFYSKVREKECLEICSFIGANNIAEGRKKIISLMKEVNAPISLREIGCEKKDFKKIISQSLSQKPNNPRQHVAKDLQLMLEEIF